MPAFRNKVIQLAGMSGAYKMRPDDPKDERIVFLPEELCAFATAIIQHQKDLYNAAVKDISGPRRYNCHVRGWWDVYADQTPEAPSVPERAGVQTRELDPGA